MKYFHGLMELESAIIVLDSNVELFRLAARGIETSSPMQIETGMDAMVDILLKDRENLYSKFNQLFETIKEDTHEKPIQTKHPKRKK